MYAFVRMLVFLSFSPCLGVEQKFSYACVHLAVQKRDFVYVCLWTNLFQIADCVSVPTFCHFVDHLWLLLKNSSFKNL